MSFEEKARIAELESYHIINSLPEKEFDYIVELAAAICDAPVSIINIVDSDRTWFKAQLGTPEGLDGTPRSISFCSEALKTPLEVMQVEDTLQDPRFKDNPFVVNEPNVRFYAGSPLVTPNGHVLGTLCVFDNKPRQLTSVQITALRTLAKKVMENLEAKKMALKQKQERDYMEYLLRKVTDRAPGAIFKFQITAEGKMSFIFISNGVEKIFPGLTAQSLMEDATLSFDYIHPADKERMEKGIWHSRENLSRFDEEYRILVDGKEVWHKALAIPEKREDGSVVWFGTFQDVTRTKEYISAIEQQNQILFEIAWEQSHVVRGPLSRIMALVNTLNSFELDAVNRELLQHIGRSAVELDEIIRNIVQKSEGLKAA